MSSTTPPGPPHARASASYPKSSRQPRRVPLISGTGQPAPDLSGERLAQLEPLLPHHLMADRGAASSQDLIHMAQAQGEAEIEPDRVADDLGREAVTGVAGTGGHCHPDRLRDRTRP